MEAHNGGDVIRRTTDYSTGPFGSAGGSMEFPAAGESLTGTEEVIFLEPGDEKAQNIVKAMSHQNAGEVVQLLSLEGPLNLTDISERLNISLNAAKYHIENLKNAGILEISDTRYSVKGKKVKIYRLKNQVFIVAPKMTSVAQVRSALMKYNAAFVIFISVFCVSLVTGSLPRGEIPFYPGSLGAENIPAVMSESTIISSLVTAAAVTIILLVIYQIYTNRQAGQSQI